MQKGAYHQILEKWSILQNTPIQLQRQQLSTKPITRKCNNNAQIFKTTHKSLKRKIKFAASQESSFLNRVKICFVQTFLFIFDHTDETQARKKPELKHNV